MLETFANSIGTRYNLNVISNNLIARNNQPGYMKGYSSYSSETERNARSCKLKQDKREAQLFFLN